MIYSALDGHIEYVLASDELKDISSSVVKAFVKHGVSVVDYAPLFVQGSLEERINKQFKVGITGGIAVGKSYVSASLAKTITAEFKVPVHNVNVDQILRDVYDEDSVGAQNMRNELANILGLQVLSADKKNVNRDLIKEKLFDSSCLRSVRLQVQAITKSHVERKYREALQGKQGVVIIEWAQMAEMNMTHWVNNNVVVVGSLTRDQFVKARGISSEQFSRIDIHQWSVAQKVRIITKQISLDQSGCIIQYDNKYGDDGGFAIQELAKQVVEMIS